MSGGRQLKRKSLADHVDEALRRVEQLERRYDPPFGYYEIKLFADRNALDGNLDDVAILVSTGDAKFLFPIPPDLDGTHLVLAEAGLSLPGSDVLELTAGNCGSDPTNFPGTSMTVDPITIAAGDVISWTAGSEFGTTEIDAGNDMVESGDWISFNVVSDGGGDAEGLVAILQFIGWLQ
jgi:hypothetical protein